MTSPRRRPSRLGRYWQKTFVDVFNKYSNIARRWSESLPDICHDCSTSEAFSPRTVLTENISTCVQHILLHFPTTMAFPTTSTITFSLPGFSSSPDWFPVTRTRGAWCRFRGYWRSRPTHLSPRYRIYPQEWHWKDIHSHTIPIHPCTLLKKRKRKEQNTQLTKHDAFICWPSSCPMWWWAAARKIGTCSSWLHHVGGLLLGQYWQKTFVDVFSEYSNIARQQSPF